MLKDLAAWLLKIALQMVIWVFVLSFKWDGRSLFDHGHKILVENAFVDMVEEEANRLFNKIYETGKLTFAEISGKNDKTEKR